MFLQLFLLPWLMRVKIDLQGRVFSISKSMEFWSKKCLLKLEIQTNVSQSRVLGASMWQLGADHQPMQLLNKQRHSKMLLFCSSCACVIFLLVCETGKVLTQTTTTTSTMMLTTMSLPLLSKNADTTKDFFVNYSWSWFIVRAPMNYIEHSLMT